MTFKITQAVTCDSQKANSGPLIWWHLYTWAGAMTSNQYKLGDEWFESSPAEKGLGILVDKKLDMRPQRVLAAQKANHILGCIRSSVVHTLREVILSLSPLS